MYILDIIKITYYFTGDFKLKKKSYIVIAALIFFVLGYFWISNNKLKYNVILISLDRKMELEHILQSPQIKIHSLKEFKRKYHPERNIIHSEKHKNIVRLADEVGIFNLFRKQLPNQSSRSLWFFKNLLTYWFTLAFSVFAQYWQYLTACFLTILANSFYGGFT